MAKTSMSEIARIVGQVARFDRHGKTIIYEYLAQDLGNETYTLEARDGKVRMLPTETESHTVSGMVPEISVTRYRDREGTE